MACVGRHTLVVCVVLVTAGCMIGPDFKSPKAPIAAQWLEADYKPVRDQGREGGLTGLFVRSR